MSACGCACPCMCETQKVKAGERGGGREKGGTVEAADARNEKLVVVKWREGEGGACVRVWEQTLVLHPRSPSQLGTNTLPLASSPLQTT